MAELQAQLDHFATYFDNVLPHRAIAPRTLATAFAARTKVRPANPPITTEGRHRLRRRSHRQSGCVTLRYRSKLFQIGVGSVHAGVRVLLVNHLDVRVITEDGELLRQLTLDPAKTYQPNRRSKGPARS